MADFKELVSYIDKVTNKFIGKLPAIQDKLLKEILLIIKDLDIRNGNVVTNTANLKKIGQIKSKIEAIISDSNYTDAVKEYAASYDKVITLQNQYYNTLFRVFEPPKVTAELKKVAISNVVDNLTEKGFAANVTQGIQDLLTTAITSGGSYASLTEQLNNYLVDNKTGEGVIQKYASTIAKDSINEFGRQYTKVISDDLKLSWFRFSNSLLTSSREWCIAMREREWVHISEFPKLLVGDFKEFKDIQGRINSKTGLPNGMKDGTDASNLQAYCGGYNCGHIFRPVTESLVPLSVRNRVYATAEYAQWAQRNSQ